MSSMDETTGGGEFFVDVGTAPTRYAAPDADHLDTRLKARLVEDYHFPDMEKMVDGVCPGCGKKTLHAAGPRWLHVYCSRTEHCGFDALTQQLYPELFADWTSRFPDDAAEQFLRYAWGVDPLRVPALRGTFWDPKGDRGTVSLEFALAEGIGIEVLADPVTFRGKSGPYRLSRSIKGDVDGHWWTLPGVDLAAADQVWIATDIRDALSLALSGVAAVAIVKADNYPAHALTQLAAGCMGQGRPGLVWALAADQTYHLREWVKRATAEGWQCRAAVPPGQGRDALTWNGLFQRDKLAESHREEYLYQGSLVVAKSARDKALLIHAQRGQQEFPFDFGKRLYWFKLDMEKFNKEKKEAEKQGSDDAKIKAEALASASTVMELVKCLPIPLYYQCNPVTDESWYYFRFEFPHGGEPRKNTFTPKQLSSNSDFEARLLHVAPGSVWTGKPPQLKRLVSDWTYNIKQVQTIDFVGYSPKHEAYVFTDHAFKDGKCYPLNEEDFFDLPRLSVKSLSHSVRLDLNTDPDQFRTDWVSTLWTAYGAKGFTALAWWLGSLFAEQIRSESKSYPFLELVGEAGSGKSTLLFFFWKLCGRDDYEGFDATDSSAPGISRTFNQVSNLPTVVLEGDRTQDKDGGRPRKGLDVESFKKLYNGNPYRTRGVATGGNETYEPPFRSALCISQNLEVAGSQAILERLIHILFDASGHTDATRIAAERLEQIPLREVSGFLVRAVCAAKAILQTYAERYAEHSESLRKDSRIKKSRIVRNHAQMRALVDCLALVIPITEEQRVEVYGFILDLAAERQLAISQDHPLVQDFWDTFDFIEDSTDVPVLDHSADDALIAINLVHFEEVVNTRKGRATPRADLMRVLKTSRQHKFLGIQSVHSVISHRYNKALAEGETPKPKTVKCWVFER